MKNLALIFMVLSYPGLFVSLVTVNRVRSMVESRQLKKYWDIVCFVNVFFIVTYLAFIFALGIGDGISSHFTFLDTMISTMFMVGGGWVFFLTKVVGFSAAEKVKIDLAKKRRLQIVEFNEMLGKKLNLKNKELEKNMLELLKLMGMISDQSENLDELKKKLSDLKNKSVQYGNN